MLCNSQTMWVVVLVESGIPTLVEIYSIEDDAATREQFLQNAMNVDYDATGVFEVKIGMEPIPSSCTQQGFQNRV